MTTYLINRLLFKILDYKTPFEIIYKIPPALDNLKTFGSLAFATDLRCNDKLKAKSIPCVFLSFPNNQKRYLLLDLKNKNIFVSRHMSFLEDKFSFKETNPYDLSEDCIEF